MSLYEKPHTLVSLGENVKSHDALSPETNPIDFIFMTPVTYTSKHLFFSYKNLAERKTANTFAVCITWVDEFSKALQKKTRSN